MSEVREIVPTLAIAIIIILPIILLEQSSHASRSRIIITTIVIGILWFLSYALLHELSHVLGFYLTGVEVTDHKLIPYFWQGDFSNAYVIVAESTPGKRFIGQVTPYVRDLVFAIMGYILIKRLSFSSNFLLLLVFTLLVSSSLYDVATNFWGFVGESRGDFYRMKEYIGVPAVYLMGVSMLLIIGFLMGAGFNSIKKKAKN